MPKTKEQIRAYNKEYFARPDVRARAKVRNAKPEHVARRRAYKKTKEGKEVNKASRKRNWDKNEPLRHKQLLWRYGLTPKEYEELLFSQEGRCAICLRIYERRMHIDHDHKTGVVRGLLCSFCNMGLGLFRDDKTLLEKAIKYLK